MFWCLDDAKGSSASKFYSRQESKKTKYTQKMESGIEKKIKGICMESGSKIARTEDGGKEKTVVAAGCVVEGFLVCRGS